MLEMLSRNRILLGVMVVGLSMILQANAEPDVHCNLASETERNKKYFNMLRPIFDHVYKAEDTNYTYQVGICSNKVKPDEPEAAAIQTERTGDKKTYVLGTNKNILVTGGTDWILVQYYNGTNYTSHCNHQPRQITIMVVCNEKQEGQLSLLEENTDPDLDDCYYIFELASKYACTGKPSEGMSGLEIFLLIFLTGVLVYFLIGFLYQRIVVGAQGLEQIPNYPQWKEFGKLVADGCDFICRCGDRQEAKMYRSIDENLPPAIDREDRDRDDSMLNL